MEAIDTTSRRPPLLLLVQDLDGGGGMETVLRHQLPSLTERYECTVVAYTVPPELQDVVTWTRLPRPSGPGWVRTIWYAVAVTVALPLLRRRAGRRTATPASVWSTGGLVLNRVDVVSVHFLHAAFVADNGWAPGHRGLRRINAAWARLVGLTLERWCFARNRHAGFGAVSSRLAQAVDRHYPGRRCVVTPNGVDLPPSSDLESSEQRGGLRAVFLGGDWTRKGLPAVLEAVALVDNVTLAVVGTGPDRVGPHAATRLGISDRVTFHGWQPAASHLRAADVMIFPSRYETFGLAVFEAAAAGLAIITTPVGAVTEVVEHEQTGLLVAPGDTTAIVRHLRRLADEPALRERLGSAARAKAQSFSWEASVASVDALLQDHLARPRRRATSGLDRRDH